MTEREELRTAIADLIPLSLLDGRDRRAGVFDVADEIMSLLERRGVMLPKPTKRVRYNHGGSAIWTAEEHAPGWWHIVEWEHTTRGGISLEELLRDFTEVEDER